MVNRDCFVCILVVLGVIGILTYKNVIYTKEEKVTLFSEDIEVKDVLEFEKFLSLEYDSQQLAFSFEKVDEDYLNEVVVSIKSYSHETEGSVRNVYNMYKGQNSDVVGLLYVPNTNVNLPVMHSEEPQFYLNRGIDKSVNKIGLPYIYYSSSDFPAEVNLVQAHNLKNDKAFSTLLKFMDSKFIRENQYCYIFDGAQVYKCKLFSARVLDSKVEKIPIEFNSERDKAKYMRQINSYSIEVLEEPSEKRDMLILSTCTSIRKQDRFLLYYTIESALFGKEALSWKEITELGR